MKLKNLCQKNILIIQGPHMPLISHIFKPNPNKITINLINKTLKAVAKKLNCKVKIIQTSHEGKAVESIQKNRKKTDGIIIFPGPWQETGYSLNSTLAILKIPFITILVNEKKKVLNGIKNIDNKDVLLSCKLAIETINQLQ